MVSFKRESHKKISIHTLLISNGEEVVSMKKQFSGFAWFVISFFSQRLLNCPVHIESFLS